MPLTQQEADQRAEQIVQLAGRLILWGGKVSDQDRSAVTTVGKLVEINNELTTAIQQLAQDVQD